MRRKPSASPHRARRTAVLAVLLACLTLAQFLTGCRARKDFPQPSVGFHDPSYSVILGRIHQVPAADPDAPPFWVIRFGEPTDAYQGELALTDNKNPTQFTLGLAGGEMVEVHGHFYGPETKDYNGRWYVVDSIKLWTGYRQ